MTQLVPYLKALPMEQPVAMSVKASSHYEVCVGIHFRRLINVFCLVFKLRQLVNNTHFTSYYGEVHSMHLIHILPVTLVEYTQIHLLVLLLLA